jgi:hypothetical protein
MRITSSSGPGDLQHREAVESHQLLGQAHTAAHRRPASRCGVNTTADGGTPCPVVDPQLPGAPHFIAQTR